MGRGSSDSCRLRKGSQNWEPGGACSLVRHALERTDEGSRADGDSGRELEQGHTRTELASEMVGNIGSATRAQLGRGAESVREVPEYEAFSRSPLPRLQAHVKPTAAVFNE